MTKYITAWDMWKALSRKQRDWLRAHRGMKRAALFMALDELYCERLEEDAYWTSVYEHEDRGR